MPAENPFNPDLSGMNPYGRWFYGPWFYPATPLCFANGGTDPEAVLPYCIKKGTVPNPFYDPPVFPIHAANTTSASRRRCPARPTYPGGRKRSWTPCWSTAPPTPTVTVQPQAYRFRILNAAHDRFLNLQLYKASHRIVDNIVLTAGGSGYAFEPRSPSRVAGARALRLRQQ